MLRHTAPSPPAVRPSVLGETLGSSFLHWQRERHEERSDANSSISSRSHSALEKKQGLWEGEEEGEKKERKKERGRGGVDRDREKQTIVTDRARGLQPPRSHRSANSPLRFRLLRPDSNPV